MPYYNSDPKRDHNFDNHPMLESSLDERGLRCGEGAERPEFADCPSARNVSVSYKGPQGMCPTTISLGMPTETPTQAQNEETLYVLLVPSAIGFACRLLITFLHSSGISGIIDPGIKVSALIEPSNTPHPKYLSGLKGHLAYCAV